MANGSTFAFLNDVNIDGDFDSAALNENGQRQGDNSSQTLIILNNSDSGGLNNLDSSAINLLTPDQNLDTLGQDEPLGSTHQPVESKPNNAQVIVTVPEIEEAKAATNIQKSKTYIYISIFKGFLI